MRNSFLILIFALLFLGGCKPKSQSSTDSKTDTTKSNNGMKMPDIGNLKPAPNNNNNNTTGTWSKDYRDKFMQGCVNKASEKVSQAEATSYCSCMAQKVEAKYPNEADVDAKLTNADIETMKPGCLTTNTPQNNQLQNNNNNNNNTSQKWSDNDQREFMDNCTPGASKSLGTAPARDYCQCMLEKLMTEYPNSADAGNVSKEHMSSLASDCLRK